MKIRNTGLAHISRFTIACLSITLSASRAPGQFIQTGAGPYDYNDTANWFGGIIDGNFTQTPALTQTVTFSANSTLTTGLTFALGGTPSVTLRGDGTDRSITLGGDVSVSGTTTTVVLGSSTAGNRLNLDLGGTDRSISIATGNGLTVNNVISGSNAVTKTDAGNLSFTGANTYSGGTTVNGGILFLNATNALASTGSVVINGTAAGTTQVSLGTGSTQTIGALTFGGAGQSASAQNTFLLNTGSTLTLGGTVTYDATNNPLAANINGPGTLALGGDRIFAIADSTNSTFELNVQVPVTGSGQSLTKTGAGLLVLSVANSYDGGTILNGGRILLNVNNTLASTGNVTINNTAGAHSTLTLNNNVSQTIGTLTLGGGAISNSQNNISLNAGSTLTLGGTVTYNATGNPGATTISGPGTLALGASRTFDVGDSSSTLGEINITAPVSGGSLTKIGAGNLRLGGANTYTGGTTVTAGSLIVANTSGSGVGTGALAVQSGARLRGLGGFIGGATTIEGGGILGSGGSGGSAATLTFNAGLTLLDNAVFNFTLGTTSDKFVIANSSILTGATTPGSLTINLTAGTGFAASTYTLFDFTSGGTPVSFNVSDFTLGTTISGYTYNLAIAGNQLQLTASAIPEPSTYAAILSAVGLLAALRRRRQISRSA